MTNPLKPVELFLAVGLATTIGVGSSVNATETNETVQEVNFTLAHDATHQAQGGEGDEGGEGGEGGEAGVSSGNPNVDYMTTLGLMKGHLIAAQELIEQGNYTDAEPHIGHPVEELYGGIEDELSQRNVPQFKDNLIELHDLAKSAPESPQMQEAFTTSMQSIDRAIAAVPENERQSPEFVLNVMSEMLKTAAAEYKAAIADGKIVEVVEYQDARGFVFYADELYQDIAEQMSQENPEEHQVIQASLAELKTAFPSITPPETPVKDSSEVYSLVAQIEIRS